MDKIIEKKKGWRSAFTKKAMPYWLGAIVVVFVLYLVFRDNSKTLRVDKDTITVSQVTDGQFNDYIRVSGQVQPMVTIQISPLEGGTFQKIIVEEGSTVKAGEHEPPTLEIKLSVRSSCFCSSIYVLVLHNV